MNVLGPIHIQIGDRDITASFWPLTAALLTRIALEPSGVSRSTLGADLWPEVPPEKRRSRLNTTLSHTRTLLADACGEKPAFFRENKAAARISLNPRHLAADVARFEALLKTRPAEAESDDSARISALTEAIVLYRGQVATGMEHTGNPARSTDELWLRPYRDEFRRRVIEAHHTLADHLSARQPDDALEVLDHAIDIDPWNQELYEAGIRIHLRLGHQHAAKRKLRDLSETLAHLGMQPEKAIVQLVAATAEADASRVAQR